MVVYYNMEENDYMYNNKPIDIDELPDEMTRSEWSRLIGVPVRKLVYEESMGRLTGRRKQGFNVFYTKEDILRWVKRYGKQFFTLE